MGGPAVRILVRNLSELDPPSFHHENHNKPSVKITATNVVQKPAPGCSTGKICQEEFQTSPAATVWALGSYEMLCHDMP